MNATKAANKSSRKPNIITAKMGAPSEIDRSARIAVAAYQRAEARAFEPGHELDDWLKAEVEVA